MNSSATAALVLENGKVFWGYQCGARKNTIAEVVFSTGMTGYEEAFTDPSYCGQILVTTVPHIGNTGWNQRDEENPIGKLWISGLVVHKLSKQPSNWRSEHTLETKLIEQNIPVIQGIDTRALVRVLRDEGSMRGGIFGAKNPDQTLDIAECLAHIGAAPQMLGTTFSHIVSTKQPYIIPVQGEKKATLGIIDLGLKSSTPNLLAERGVESHILPFGSILDDFLEHNIDGILIPNGPGDPATAHESIQLVQAALQREIPVFGICFGNQIIGQALGRNTYKMQFGHRGINIPVKSVDSAKIDITAQNHGFALQGEPGEQFDTPYGKAEFSHYCLNDNTIEGVRLLSGLAMAVQYHPEAAAGPHDAAHIFQQFVDVMTKHKVNF